MEFHRATVSVVVLDGTDPVVTPALVKTKAETLVVFVQGLRGRLEGDL